MTVIHSAAVIDYLADAVQPTPLAVTLGLPPVNFRSLLLQLGGLTIGLGRPSLCLSVRGSLLRIR